MRVLIIAANQREVRSELTPKCCRDIFLLISNRLSQIRVEEELSTQSTLGNVNFWMIFVSMSETRGRGILVYSWNEHSMQHPRYE